jgi:hypothetical protein
MLDCLLSSANIGHDGHFEYAFFVFLLLLFGIGNTMCWCIWRKVRQKRCNLMLSRDAHGNLPKEQYKQHRFKVASMCMNSGCQKLNQVLYQAFWPALTISNWCHSVRARGDPWCLIWANFPLRHFSQLFKTLPLVHITTNSSYPITLTFTAY